VDGDRNGWDALGLVCYASASVSVCVCEGCVCECVCECGHVCVWACVCALVGTNLAERVQVVHKVCHEVGIEDLLLGEHK
jgi:hypothetical protein